MYQKRLQANQTFGSDLKRGEGDVRSERS